MAKDLSEQLSRIGHKAELLTTRYITLRQQNQQLRSELDQAHADIERCNAELQRLRLEVEHFRVSSVIAPDSDSVRRTRTIISNLVREIDACVADLTGDI